MKNQDIHVLQKQNWRQLASIQVGGTICLPLLIVGYEIAKQGHPLSILLSIFWGNLLLFGLALVAGFMSIKRTITTVEHASLYFGSIGRKLFAITLSFSMLGWFAIQTQCMGQDIQHLMQHLKGEEMVLKATENSIIAFTLSLLMVCGALWGLNFLSWMSNICLPLLVVTIGYAVYQAGIFPWNLISLPGSLFTVWDGKAVSLVLASSMAATIDLPTFYRHATCRQSTFKASFVNYLIAMPLVQLAGVCLYESTHATTLSEALAFHSSSSWKIWTVCFMLLAGWTTNHLNLYSASLSLMSLFNHLSFFKAMGLAGIIGCFLVFVPILDQFALVLDLMGILVIAMGGVMLMAFILESYAFPMRSTLIWLSWGVGVGAGLFPLLNSHWGFGTPVLEAGLASMLSLLLTHILEIFVKSFLFIPKEGIK